MQFFWAIKNLTDNQVGPFHSTDKEIEGQDKESKASCQIVQQVRDVIGRMSMASRESYLPKGNLLPNSNNDLFLMVAP